MKYASFPKFLEACHTGEFTGHVIVDNDCVGAYQPTSIDGDTEHVFNFGGEGPEGALIDVLTQLGVPNVDCA